MVFSIRFMRVFIRVHKIATQIAQNIQKYKIVQDKLIARTSQAVSVKKRFFLLKNFTSFVY